MKFKCKLTGCIYNFEYEHDIAEMLNHPQYEVVEDVENKPLVVEKQTLTKSKG